MRVEPGLKPYQPNQRRKVPRTWRAAEWPVKAESGMPFSGLPLYGVHL